MLRRSAILLTCLFALSLAIIGCGGGGGGGTANPTGPTASSVETASLSGTVLYNNTPLANASVYLYKSEKAPTIGMTQLPALRSSLIAQQLISDGAYSTTSNAAGVYSFTDVPVGQYTLIAVKDENHQFAQTGVLLGQVTSLNPQLTPTGKIGGRVTTTIGTSEQGASAVFVYVSGTSYIALTDASGYFVINNVPSNSLSGSTAYEVQVMPGKGTASPVTGVVVNPGETTNVGTISLSQQTEGYKEIAGRFVAGAGATSADLVDQFVILAAEADGALIGSSSDSSGNFSFFVNRPGTYHVIPTESALNFAPASQTYNVTALDNTTFNLTDFVLSRLPAGGSVVAGTVTWPLITDWNFTEGEIILEGSPYVDRRIISNQSPAPFRFENVPPGSYVLKANPLRNGYAGTTAAFTITQGVSLTDRALTGTFIAPIITSTPTTVAASPDQLTIPGNNFGTVAANLLAFVNDKPATIISISNTSVVINIAQVPPGENVVQLVKILPEGRLPGNKKPFTRPVLAPLFASFNGSSTDTSITYNWQNAPHVTEVQIRLLQGAVQVRPPQKILGNSFTYDNLQAGITYTIEVISTYPNLPNSLPTTYPFATKANGINNIASATLSGVVSTDNIFGFEVDNDVAFVGFYNPSTFQITLQAFNLLTNASINSRIVPVVSAANQAIISLAANSDGVFLTFTDPTEGDVIFCFNRGLTTVTASTSLTLAAPNGLGLTSPGSVKLRSLNNRIFLAAMSAADAYLRELNSSLGVAALYNSAAAGGSFADVAYDSTTQKAYFAHSDSTQIRVKAFNSMDITTSPSDVVEFMSGTDYALYASNNRIYFVKDSSGLIAEVIDARNGGYIKTITMPSFYPSSFGFDRQNRIWMSNLTGNPAILLLDAALNPNQALKIANTGMNMGLSRIKLDIVTGKMYMLYYNASSNLSVYKYDSNY